MISLNSVVFCIRMGGGSVLTDTMPLGALLLVEFRETPRFRTLHFFSRCHFFRDFRISTDHSKRLLRDYLHPRGQG